MAVLTRPRATTGARAHRWGLWRPGKLTYLTLIGLIVFSALPLYWTAVVASQPNSSVAKVPPVLVPGGRFLANAREVFGTVQFAKALTNSFIVSGSIAVSVVFFSTMAGFAFAKLRFRGRNILLLTVISTMLIPVQIAVVPLYIIMGEFGWTNRLAAVIVPFMVSAFGVFFMRQYLVEAVPTELLESGRVDGCSTIRLFWHIVLPAARPAAAVLGMLTFMQAWNDFLWPLIVLTPQNPTVQVALSTLASGYVQDYSLVFTGTAIATIPLLAVFLVLGRQIVGGIMQGAVKG